MDTYNNGCPGTSLFLQIVLKVPFHDENPVLSDWLTVFLTFLLNRKYSTSCFSYIFEVLLKMATKVKGMRELFEHEEGLLIVFFGRLLANANMRSSRSLKKWIGPRLNGEVTGCLKNQFGDIFCADLCLALNKILAVKNREREFASLVHDKRAYLI